MKRRPRRSIEIFSMSFLDVISCGFGAVILLLIIALAFEPTTIEKISKDLRALIASKEASRDSLVEENRELSQALAEKRESLLEISARIDALNTNWAAAREKFSTAQTRAQEQREIEQQLESVRQTLSAEMQRLLSQPDYKPPGEDATIGGIPVDSEYIIFVIDTSGSMKQGAWELVLQKIRQILEVYPKVKGLQVLNDMGSYMFPTYGGRWIPDTPTRRTIVLDRLKTWNSFSNSSPVEGIEAAIKAFYRPGRPTSIFVFGDDFNGASTEAVVKSVARMNRRHASGQPQVRIHTFGFPVLPLLAPAQTANFVRFAHLMRVLAEQNAGSFVGLNSLR